MIHRMRRLGIEPLEERFLPASTASTGGLENVTNLAALVGSAEASNTQTSSDYSDYSRTDSSTSAAETKSPTANSTPNGTPSGTTANQSPGDSEYTMPGAGTNTPTSTNKSAADEYNSNASGTSTQNGAQTSSQDYQGEYENKTSASSMSQLDFPIQQNPATIEGGATTVPVNGRAITTAIPNAIAFSTLATSPNTSVLPSGGIVLTASPSPDASNVETAASIVSGNQELPSNNAGQPASHPQDSTDYFTFPEVFAIRVDAAMVDETIDQFLAGLDAMIPDALDQESLLVRLGYWVIAISGTAVACELIRQDLRSRHKAHPQLSLATTPIPNNVGG
jgi:hypothetical protein